MRMGITSAFGNPLNPKTWSGAPANIAKELTKLGTVVESITPTMSRVDKMWVATLDLISGLGRPYTSEQIMRGVRSRRMLAKRVEREARRLGVGHVLHTGTFDLSSERSLDMRHYLYCDHTWALTRAHHLDVLRYNDRAMAAFEQAEHEALNGLSHIFTFGDYVRDNVIKYYGVLPHHVTAVGAGMGDVQPYNGPKDFTQQRLLFVAKHLWVAKGGPLLMDAFRIARKRLPHLSLDIVGAGNLDDVHMGVRVHKHLPWEDLQQLYRDATLLVQPMLNDPWGQVYLEAMVSRTPVMGLNRNGLPELTNNGQHGFLVEQADPTALADAIVDALSDPARLERMAKSAQDFATNYSWAKAAREIDNYLKARS